jgi:hypothetical protein
MAIFAGGSSNAGLRQAISNTGNIRRIAKTECN